MEIRSTTADFFAGLAVLCVALYAFIEAYNMPSFGDPDEAAYNTPGMTPMVVSGALVIMAVALIIRSRHVSFSWTFNAIGSETIRVLITFGIILGFIIIMPLVGYAPATFLLLFSFQMVFARKRTIKFILIWGVGLSGLLTAILFHVFGNIFMIPLP